ncbi:hypothetical protein AB0G73_36535 [Streptomyces sp. NPDC020719]|uniref:hypothetical protein n=1 Tax=Streptomyces sp. NPDC020719 TaxID=3154896 RepID=UPI0034065E3F
MHSATNDTQKPDVPALPLWTTIPVAFVVTFVLGEHYGLAWWQRFAAMATIGLVLEAANQAVRRTI